MNFRCKSVGNHLFLIETAKLFRIGENLITPAGLNETLEFNDQLIKPLNLMMSYHSFNRCQYVFLTIKIWGK